MDLNAPIVGIAATPDGGGYWLVASDGGVFSYGDAGFYGSPAGSGHAAFIGLLVNPGGHGYRVFAADGTAQAFGT